MNTDMDYLLTERIWIIDSAAGIHIGQCIGEYIAYGDRAGWSGVSESDLDSLLAGPDCADYESAWESVVEDAIYTDRSGYTWRIEEDQCVFLSPTD